jgi:hypothetical protein
LDEEKARSSANLVSENANKKSLGELKKDIAALTTKCRDQLHQQRFLRQAAEDRTLAEDRCILEFFRD